MFIIFFLIFELHFYFGMHPYHNHIKIHFMRFPGTHQLCTMRNISKCVCMRMCMCICIYSFTPPKINIKMPVNYTEIMKLLIYYYNLTNIQYIPIEQCFTVCCFGTTAII